jgi:hypothetical protein
LSIYEVIDSSANIFYQQSSEKNRRQFAGP